MIHLQEVKMTEKVFSRFPHYFWPGTKFSYSDTNGTSSGISMIQNPYKAAGVVISVNTHFLVTSFTTQTGSYNLFSSYPSDTRNGRVFVWDKATNVADSMRQENILCMGDFHTSLYPSEKIMELEEFLDNMQNLEDFLRRNDS